MDPVAMNRGKNQNLRAERRLRRGMPSWRGAMTMLMRLVEDWDNAYANTRNIPRGDSWPGLWVEPAKTFREKLSADGRAVLDAAYGDHARNRFDLFRPKGEPKGLVVFVHGGYWMALDKSYWSHLAAGSVERGYAVAVPSYPLCPEVRIADIVRAIGKAIETAASLVEGPIYLTGHSAGGHLVARMVTTTSPLSEAVRGRIRHVVPISGLHDLRSLMKTAMNNDLRIDDAEALAESPALLRPLADTRVTCWVGEGERAEFLRQNALLANIWTGLGASTAVVEEADRHHFDVVDGLTNPAHPLTRLLVSE
jgi:arylformamidase